MENQQGMKLKSAPIKNLSGLMLTDGDSKTVGFNFGMLMLKTNVQTGGFGHL